MLAYLREKLRTAWYSLSSVPTGYFSPYPTRSEYYNLTPKSRALHAPEQALTLSPFWAALRLYQNSMAVLPLVTYRKDANGGRHRLEDPIVYNLLHDRPNPAMSRAAFFEFALKEYFLHGEFFALIQWAKNHRLLGLYPLHARDVVKIDCDDQWNKTYHVTGYDQPFTDDEMIHVTHFSTCGLRGISFIRYACESLGLHKQVLDSATAYYHNAARPSGYIRYPGKVTKDAMQNIKEGFKDDYQGTVNTGKIPILSDNAEYNTFPNTNATDAQIIEAIGQSVDDIARWFDNLSPLVLGNLARGTYSNSAADKLAFWQKNLLPLCEKFQLELNYKLFGLNSNVYCEFLTDNILRADPKTQAEVWHLGITDGYILRSEVRSWLNLDPVDGLDVPLAPLNMADASTNVVTDEGEEEDSTQAVTQDASTKVVTDEDEPKTDEQAEATASNDLRATVGGSAQVAALQTAYYKGELVREAAIANLVLIFGFSQSEAEQLLPLQQETHETENMSVTADAQQSG